jgi:hypothetical protein
VIGIDQLVYVVLFILVVGAIAGLLYWLIGYAESQGMPAPFGKIARIVLVVFLVLVAIGILLSLIGRPIIRF